MLCLLFEPLVVLVILGTPLRIDLAVHMANWQMPKRILITCRVNLQCAHAITLIFPPLLLSESSCHLIVGYTCFLLFILCCVQFKIYARFFKFEGNSRMYSIACISGVTLHLGAPGKNMKKPPSTAIYIKRFFEDKIFPLVYGIKLL